MPGGDPGPTTPAAFTPGGYQAFEHRWALAAAFGFRQEVGRERAAERTHALAGRLKEGLLDVGGVAVKTPQVGELSAGLVCCGSPRRPAAGRDRGRAPRRARGDASLTPYAERYVRFGPSIVNSEEDVDRALAAMAELAG
jgi:selenocysteine lyase/cysteine desulfurase